MKICFTAKNPAIPPNFLVWKFWYLKHCLQFAGPILDLITVRLFIVRRNRMVWKHRCETSIRKIIGFGSRDQSKCKTTWWIIAIPGANCAFPQAVSHRDTQNKNIGIFKLPSRSGDFHKQWKNDFLSVSETDILDVAADLDSPLSIM